MPTKRIFDLVVISSLLLTPAIGLVRMSMRRHSRESEGLMGRVGDAMVVCL